VIYVLFTFLGYSLFTVDFVISLRAADVADAGFPRELMSFWGLSSMASILRSDLSLLVSNHAFKRNFEHKFVVEPVFPIQL
jgi:hypothetical protein